MYGEKSEKELLELLKQYHMLTFESQLSLNREIEKRNLTIDKNNLETAITYKVAQIKNLEYLKDFGFKAEMNNDGVTVTRTTKAIIMDVAAVIIGFVVFCIGVYGLGSLVSLFVNGTDINVFSLAINSALASLMFIGFRFFSAVQRLFDYSGFQLSNFNGMITLKKRFDLKLEQIKEKASELLLEIEEEEMVLRLGNRTIFNSNAENIVQRMTIEELAKALKQE